MSDYQPGFSIEQKREANHRIETDHRIKSSDRKDLFNNVQTPKQNDDGGVLDQVDNMSAEAF